MSLVFAAAVGGCDGCDNPAFVLVCTAKIATQEGAFEGEAARNGEETEAQTKKRAVSNACTAYCGALDGADLGRCAPRCIVDIEAAKMGARVTCEHRQTTSAP